MADGMSITVDGKTHQLDDFTLGDLEWLEEYIGAPLSDPDSMGSFKSMVGLVYLVRRQDDPNYTLEEAKQTKLSVLNEMSDNDDTPKGDAAEPKKKRPTKAATGS